VKVVFRVDASLNLGSGHVMRCRTLADALRGGGAEVRFVCREYPGHLIRLLRDDGYTCAVLPTPEAGGPVRNAGRNAALPGVELSVDARQTLEALGDFRPDWLVVDHYGLDAAWERHFKTAVERIFVIDDLADRLHDCDLLLDQNPYVDMDKRYTGLLPRHARQLLGPRYALLRPEFRKARASLRARDGTIRRILISFGGVDLTQETEKALDALRQLKRQDITVDVVVGDGNPRADDISAQCSKMPNVTFHQQVSNMAELMARSDFSLGAGGSTHWERCCVGLPAAVTVTAANQAALTRDLAERHVVLEAGTSDTMDASRYRSLLNNLPKELLVALQTACFALVDGRGVARVALSLCDEPVRLRRAALEDADQALSWRNDIRTRKHSLNREPVTPAGHLSWWTRSLGDVGRVLLIGVRCGLDIGVLRYDLGADSVAVVSVYLDPDLHGQGLGVALLRAGNQWMMRHCPRVSELRAKIVPQNEASRRAFEAAGYRFLRGYWRWNTNQAMTET